MKQNKYNAVKTIVNGVSFHSKKEAMFYVSLLPMIRSGAISDFMMQVPFRFKINEKLMFTYKADFVYVLNGEKLIVDVKGYKTPIYKLKKKIIESHYGIKITEV